MKYWKLAETVLKLQYFMLLIDLLFGILETVYQLKKLWVFVSWVI